MSNVILFAPVSLKTPAAIDATIFFSREARQAIRGLPYAIPGLVVSFEACAQGDEWAGVRWDSSSEWLFVSPDRAGLSIRDERNHLAKCRPADLPATLGAFLMYGEQPPVVNRDGLTSISRVTLNAVRHHRSPTRQ